MGPSIQKSSSGGPVNTKAFIRWAREYESLHPRGPSIQKPSSGGPVNTKAFIQRARPHESLHPMGPSRQKPDDDGDGDDVGDDGFSSSIKFYIHKLPINRFSGRYMLLFILGACLPVVGMFGKLWQVVVQKSMEKFKDASELCVHQPMGQRSRAAY